ncbi:MAG: hypothetical protein F4103_16245, partial [Boseongicola sp. SB0673_bin_14]|nr:hypothetical protein [Boseongicola sp. SB0673_bin_14]
FTPEEGGTYYVSAGHRDTLFPVLGEYSLSVIDVGAADDFAEDSGTTGRVAVGGTATGEIAFVTDVDWFAVSLKAGTSYRIDVKGSATGDGTLDDPVFLGVFDSSGSHFRGTVDDNGGEQTNSKKWFVPKEDGTYYLAVIGYTDANTSIAQVSKGTYTVSVVQAEREDDFADDTSTSGTADVGGSATGEIQYEGDEDWFAVTLEAGKTYRFDLKGAPTGDGTLANPYIGGIHDARGRQVPGTVDDNGGEGPNSRVTFTAGEDATYYVEARAFAEFPAALGTYTLAVEEVADGL